MIDRIKSLIAEYERMGDGSGVIMKVRTTRAMREQYGRKHSHGPLSWDEGGAHYEAFYDVQCTSSGVYAELYCTRNSRKAGIEDIKASLKRMEVE